MKDFLQFVKWFLETFTTRTHFVRFLGTLIVVVTLVMLCLGVPVPEGWWVAFGAVIAFYFKSSDTD